MQRTSSFAALLLAFGFALSGEGVQAQLNLDSLLQVWHDRSLHDTARAKAYSDYISDGFLFTDPDTAVIMAEELLSFAEERGEHRGRMSAWNIMSIASALKGDNGTSLAISRKILALAEELGDEDMIASTTSNMGIAYKRMGDLPKALECYQRGLSHGEATRDSSLIVKGLTNIGAIYRLLGDFPKALDHYQRSLAILEELDEPRTLFTVESNLGNLYIDWKRYDKALEILQRSLATSERSGNIRGTSMSLMNIGNLFMEQGELPQALDHIQRALLLFEQFGDQLGMAKANKALGDIHLQRGDPKQAVTLCRKGLELARSIGSAAEEQRSCTCLYRAYKAQGDNTHALQFHELAILLKDSLFNEENTKKLTRLEMQYDFDKKEAATQAEQEKKDAIAAQELRRQKIVRNGFMGGFVLVALFAGVFLTQRNRIGKEKKRSEELLLNILPEEVADELKLKGEAEAKLIDQVTVLFTDFKGFTAMSEKLSPKELVKDLHECFSAFDNICEKHGLEKIKTIGDAYMAAGGLPTPNTTHATDVIKAAFEMRDFIAEGKARKIAAGLPYFEIRIGIHTGPVVAGIVGVKKFSYDIWGDTVNTASRMESSGEVGQVNISEATYELVKDESGLTFIPRGKVLAKGKGEMEMYFVHNGASGA